MESAVLHPRTYALSDVTGRRRIAATTVATTEINIKGTSAATNSQSGFPAIRHYGSQGQRRDSQYQEERTTPPRALRPVSSRESGRHQKRDRDRDYLGNRESNRRPHPRILLVLARLGC